MKEFFVGLIIIALMLLLSIVAVLLLPLIVVLGFILKWLVTLLFVIFTIWLIGAAALKAMEYSRKGDF